MQGRPTGVVAACKDIDLGREIQELFASPNMRVNTTTDVTGAADGQAVWLATSSTWPELSLVLFASGSFACWAHQTKRPL